MNTIHFDLNVTKQCSMRCAYCIEAGTYTKETCLPIVPDFCDFIDRFLGNKPNSIVIQFWGGEPTLQEDTVLALVKRYEHNDRVTFLLYSNGLILSERFKAMLLRIKGVRIDKAPKFISQFSYDGNPIHDIKRKTIAGESTSPKVKETIQWAKQNQVPFAVKATITLDTLQYLHQAYLDTNELLKGSNEASYSSSGYAPTLDYLNDTGLSEEQDSHLATMITNLKLIAKELLQFPENATFRWFESNKASCTAGEDLFVIDTDGKIYTCHGCLYSACKEDHYVGRLTDDVSVLDISRAKHNLAKDIEPIECSTCEALFCVRCNAVRYAASKKPTYEERWKDYTNNPNLCRFYKEAGKIARAYHQIKNKQLGQKGLSEPIIDKTEKSPKEE